MQQKIPPRFGTIKAACKIVGGDESPIHPATYRRGAKAGLYAPLVKVAPNVVRVDLDALAEKLREAADTANAA